MLDSTLKQFAACGTNGSSVIPSWHEYITCDADGTPQIDNINDIWGIAWGLVDIILFVGSVAAVFFIIYGGIQFITSQGAPDKTAQARKTITYAIAGLVMVIVAQAAIQFIAGGFGADVGI